MNPYIGHPNQLSGFLRFTYTEGLMQGMSAIEVYNRSGLRFTVLPDRGLDIGFASYKGNSLVHVSKSGFAASPYYQNSGAEWLRTFGCGLLCTCGLTQVGPPVTVDGADYGLHGRISAIPATEVCTRRYYEEDDEVLEISGKVTQAVLFGEYLELHRVIKTYAQKNIIEIDDTITNKAFSKELLMVLYHCNFGYPLLSENSVLAFNAASTVPRDEQAKKGMDNPQKILPPTKDFAEQVFFHSGVNSASIKSGFCTVTMEWNAGSLDKFTQWNSFGCGDYVMGLEPGNCNPIGRAAQLDSPDAQYLDSGESKTNKLKFIIS